MTQFTWVTLFWLEIESESDFKEKLEEEAEETNKKEEFQSLFLSRSYYFTI